MNIRCDCVAFIDSTLQAPPCALRSLRLLQARDVRDAAINLREQSVKLCVFYHERITAQLVGGLCR